MPRLAVVNLGYSLQVCRLIIRLRRLVSVIFQASVKIEYSRGRIHADVEMQNSKHEDISICRATLIRVRLVVYMRSIFDTSRIMFSVPECRRDFIFTIAM